MMRSPLASILIKVLTGIGVVLLSFFVTLRVFDYWDSNAEHPNAAPFRVGDPVKRDGERNSILPTRGPAILLVNREPGSGTVVGAVEGAGAYSTGRLSLVGWAIDPGASRPSSLVVALVGDRIWTWGAPSLPRSDIAALGPSYRDSGFSLHVQGGSKAQLKDLRVYAIMQDGTAHELNYAAGLREP